MSREAANTVLSREAANILEGSFKNLGTARVKSATVMSREAANTVLSREAANILERRSFNNLGTARAKRANVMSREAANILEGRSEAAAVRARSARVCRAAKRPARQGERSELPGSNSLFEFSAHKYTLIKKHVEKAWKIAGNDKNKPDRGKRE